ncbi:hypothetical protein Salat_2965400 [Sesamum alatum]|uniref:Uncharacterized protein n=1 Tax=Sesamum alatum TaxID=300844 RepID=A0AAE1XI16_9LAMI|nr:hypothetical protein Salat_2971800 [Sesamum alatum]KAK4412241.1 hypothetical protein Salat_2965400 [Sesamum alatum]
MHSTVSYRVPSLEKERQGRIARPKALFFILEIFPRRQAFSHGPFNLILRYRPFAFSSLWPGASVGFLRIGYPRGGVSDQDDGEEDPFCPQCSLSAEEGCDAIKERSPWRCKGMTEMGWRFFFIGPSRSRTFNTHLTSSPSKTPKKETRLRPVNGSLLYTYRRESRILLNLLKFRRQELPSTP